MTIDTAGPAPAQPVAPAAPRKSFFERLTGVFFAPDETFADIARKPDILLPLVVLTVIGFVTTIIAMPHLDWDAAVATQMEQVQKQSPNVSDADLERMGNITKAIAKVGGYLAPLIVIIGYLLIALVLWGAFRLMGGGGDFKQALAATLYAHFPRMILASIIGTIIIVLRGSVNPMEAPAIMMTNPAFLVDVKEQPVLFNLFASLDLFAFWLLYLLAVGFSKLSGFSKGKSAAIIIPLWLVMVILKVGMAAVGAMQNKG